MTIYHDHSPVKVIDIGNTRISLVKHPIGGFDMREFEMGEYITAEGETDRRITDIIRARYFPNRDNALAELEVWEHQVRLEQQIHLEKEKFEAWEQRLEQS